MRQVEINQRQAEAVEKTYTYSLDGDAQQELDSQGACEEESLDD